MASSTYTVNQMVQWALPFVDNVPLTRNGTTEPALSIANIVSQIVLQIPFRWRWNRVSTGFVCTPGQQDYLLGNWTANTTVNLGFRVIDVNGFSQRVTTAGVTGSYAPAWTQVNSTTPDGANVVWTNDGPIPNSSSVYSLYWIENASAFDINATLPKWYELHSKIDLALESTTSRPMNVSAQFDDGQGNITFRLMPAPDIAYPIALSLQKKPTAITNLNQTFAPIPDEYLYIVRWGFLAWSNYYLGRLADFQSANAKFVASLLAAQGGLTDVEKDIFLKSYDSFTASQMFLPKLQQSNMARGV